MQMVVYLLPLLPSLSHLNLFQLYPLPVASPVLMLRMELQRYQLLEEPLDMPMHGQQAAVLHHPQTIFLQVPIQLPLLIMPDVLPLLHLPLQIGRAHV